MNRDLINLNDLSNTIVNRTGISSEVIETIIHYHWRTIIHAVKLNKIVTVDDYVELSYESNGDGEDLIMMRLTPKTRKYLKKN